MWAKVVGTGAETGTTAPGTGREAAGTGTETGTSGHHEALA